MAGKEKTDGGAEFRNYIVTGLLRLMRRMPYEAIKVTDIVREAGVSRMTYYRHFKTKSDVLVSLVDYIIRSVNPVCHENRRNGDWYRFWLALFDYADRYASALKTIIDAGQGNLILECLNRSAFPHLQKDESAEASYRLFFLSGGMYNVFVGWLSGENRESPAEMAKICCGFMKGIVSEEAGASLPEFSEAQ
ncbi:MAG TPA: TetR/AcrR family transcriptional regulator [Candidatus Scatosoma pullistercoris]|uniref:TetR/AcrR family transcriptional regulator n=1 Tax=Candidatus Scatosoma pullistercoris TaxID=2840934 RepID=A0A9D1SGS3_9FIRM|nr:TetR/AcrR family transcriptional regulator [Candidatus Scatosoma pullistercoris]